MSEENDKKIRTALAEKVFYVPVEQVVLAGGIGQSGLFKGTESVATYEVTGPTSNGKTPCQNCEVSAGLGG